MSQNNKDKASRRHSDIPPSMHPTVLNQEGKVVAIARNNNGSTFVDPLGVNLTESPNYLVLREIVPNVDEDILQKVFKKNNLDLNASIDEALTISALIEQETEKEIQNVNKPVNRVFRTLGKNPSTGDNKGARGNTILLSNTFLASPRFRSVIDQTNKYATYFTIVFKRDTHKLGISIKNIHGDIRINQLNPGPDMQQGLAQQAGVKLGDILLGIDGEFFTPGVDVQDVTEMLKLLSGYVTLHFKRMHRVFDSVTLPEHKLTLMLREQALVDSSEATTVTLTLRRLKERALSWDNTWIKQRLDIWKVDNDLIHYAKSLRSNGNMFDITSSNQSFYSSFLDSATPTNDMNRRRSWNPSMPVISKNHEKTTRTLRPAIAARMLRAEDKKDHVVYVIWVQDIRSGVEWLVRRRFREFNECREFLLSIKGAIGKIEFPPKRITVGESQALVAERLFLLQKFLRKMSNISCTNSVHPSISKVQIIFQHFLQVGHHLDVIKKAEYMPNSKLKNMVQVFVHSITQLPVMDKIIENFIDNFNDDGQGDINILWTEERGKEVLQHLKSYIDNLQGVLFDCLYDDCVDIIHRYRKHGNNELRTVTAWANVMNRIELAQLSAETNDTKDIDVDNLKQTYERMTEDEIRALIRSAIRRQVEIEIFVPCSNRITYVLQKSFALSDRSFRGKLISLSRYPQGYFGIAIHHISPTSWDAIVQKFRKISDCIIPHDRLVCLLEMAKEIPVLFQKEHPDVVNPLGADEFLPIFIYIVVRSQIPDTIALNECLQQLCDPEIQMAETGYYLATLEATIKHILDYNERAESHSFFSCIPRQERETIDDWEHSIEAIHSKMRESAVTSSSHSVDILSEFANRSRLNSESRATPIKSGHTVQSQPKR